MSTILIVEDEKNIQRLVVVNLEARGYEVLPAGSAEEGLAILRTSLPDAMILDIKLPGMNGWSMLREINADPDLPSLPVIVITASSLLSQPEEYLYPHLVEKLSKPLSVSDLLAVIRKIFA